MNAGTLSGMVLLDTYRVDRLIGAGGMGSVYAASHLRLPTGVAIKVLRIDPAGNAELFDRFKREAEITSALRHPNIVQVIDFNRLEDGTPFLVMEYLDGEDLEARLRKRGPLGVDATVALARAVAGGLTAAHARGVVHRDLKPQNIFLARHAQGDETVELPKIVDFGISKIRQVGTMTQKTQAQHTQENQIMGTPNYMSPEQARGDNEHVDHRTDQFALAAILYECLSGRLAFQGHTLTEILMQVILDEPPDLRSLAHGVPEGVAGAIARALSKERDDRFPSVQDFLRALEAGATTELRSARDAPPGPITAMSWETNPMPRARQGSWLAVLAAGVGLLSLGAAVGVYLRHEKAPKAIAAVAPPLPTALPLPQSPAAPPPAPPPPPRAPQITISVIAQPPGATVIIGTQRLPPNGVVHLPRTGEPLELLVTAPGYLEHREWFHADAHQTFSVRLDPAPLPAAPKLPPPPPGRASDHHHDRHHERHHDHHSSPRPKRPSDDAGDVDIDVK